MPQATMNPYQIQNTQNFTGFGSNNPNMAIRPNGGMATSISRQASMPESMNANMWNCPSTGNVQGPYNNSVTNPPAASTMGQFGNPGGGAGMEFQNMMQRGGGGGMAGQMGHVSQIPFLLKF